MNTILELKNVNKVFQQYKAVNNLSLTVKKGEMIAILGANGAGKTTTIRMMLGLMKPTSGEISLFGGNPQDRKVRNRIGSMLQEVSVMDGLKVKEIVPLIQGYYDSPIGIEELKKLTGFEDKDWNMRTEKLSGGQKRRLNFALALAGNPDLLFFDEPTVGMDVTAREHFWKEVKELKKQGKTIIFTTHYLQEADEVAERMIMIHKGEIIGDGTPSELKEKLTKPQIMFYEKQDYSLEFYHALPFVSSVEKEKDKVTIVTTDSDQLLRKIVREELNIKQIEVKQGRLEEVFSQLLEEHKEVD